MKKMLIVLAVVFLTLVSCSDDATIVRENLERAEQNFSVYRRVVFYNGITGVDQQY